MTARRPGAFTLLEVVLALSITLGLLAVVLGTYRAALDARRQLQQQADAVAAQRRAMERITRELRTAGTWPFLRVGLAGQPHSVQFLTAALPGPVAWAARAPTDRPLPPEHDYRLVGYRLRTVEDEQTGEPVVVGLERTCQTVVAASTAEEGREIARALLTPHVKFLHLAYHDGTAWQTGWGGGDLPQAVRVTLGTEPLPEQTDPADYPFPTFQREVYLPAAGAPSPAPTDGPDAEDRP